MVGGGGDWGRSMGLEIFGRVLAGERWWRSAMTKQNMEDARTVRRREEDYGIIREGGSKCAPRAQRAKIGRTIVNKCFDASWTQQ